MLLRMTKTEEAAFHAFAGKASPGFEVGGDTDAAGAARGRLIAIDSDQAWVETHAPRSARRRPCTARRTGLRHKRAKLRWEEAVSSGRPDARDTGMTVLRSIGTHAFRPLRQMRGILRVLALVLVSTVGLGVVQTSSENLQEDDADGDERVVFRHFV